MKKTDKTEKKTATKSPPTATNNASSGGRGGAYNEADDVCLKDFGLVKGSSNYNGDISVRIMQYRGGAMKVAIMRCGTNSKTDEPWFSPKLGRLTVSEFNDMMLLLEKAQRFIAKQEQK